MENVEFFTDILIDKFKELSDIEVVEISSPRVQTESGELCVKSRKAYIEVEADVDLEEIAYGIARELLDEYHGVRVKRVFIYQVYIQVVCLGMDKRMCVIRYTEETE